MRPLIIHNVLHSAYILRDACTNFRRYSIEGITLNHEQIEMHLNRSLMLVTALSPVIGYDKASQIAHHAFEKDLTLREAALASGWINAEEFDQIVDPKQMVGNPHQDLGLSEE